MIITPGAFESPRAHTMFAHIMALAVASRDDSLLTVMPDDGVHFISLWILFDDTAIAHFEQYAAYEAMLMLNHTQFSDDAIAVEQYEALQYEGVVKESLVEILYTEVSDRLQSRGYEPLPDVPDL